MATAPSFYLPGSPADQEYQRQLALNPNLPRPIQLGGRAGNTALATAGVAPGSLPGAPGLGGSTAAGRIPQVPDPTATAGSAIAGNLANLAKLRQLFNRTSAAVGVTPEMTSAETRNINSLLNPPAQFVDIDRLSAEAGTGTGLAGSPSAFARGYRMTRDEQLRERLLGSQLLGQRVNRANQILPLQQFMQTPEGRQIWQNFANTVAAGADPEEAFQRAMALAREGLNRGFNAGYGGGAPRATNPLTGGSTYAGDVNWNNLTAARQFNVPTWPTLPTNVPGTMPPGTIAPIAPFSSGEDFLGSMGLGLGQPGVTTTPISSFMGDINVPEDLYS